MKNCNSGNSGGVSLCPLLTVLFIGLKLTGYVSWSWWWVLSPMWLPMVIVLSVLIVVVSLSSLIEYFS